MTGTAPELAETVDRKKVQKNTIEASMSLKTKIDISKRTENELKTNSN
jgi:hypothetical protein